MKKLKNTTQELEFLREASNKDVVEYTLKHSFKCKSEVLFVELYPELVPCYIELYGLCQKAGRAVFESGNWRNIEALLERGSSKYSVEALFLETGKYKQVVAWLNTHNTEKYPEKELFWSDDIEKIMNFIKKNKVSYFGQIDLLMRNNEKLVWFLIFARKLNPQNKVLAVKVASKKNASMLVDLSKGEDIFVVLKQNFAVRFAKNWKNIVNERLCAEAYEMFLKKAPFEVVLEYAVKHGIEDISEKLLDRPRESGIIKFLSKNKLSPKCEVKIFDKGCHLEIKSYIKAHELCVEAEIRLVKRGYHREIMLYLKHHSLSAEAQVLLIERGNDDEIMALVSKYPLAEIAEKALLKRGVRDEIDVWTANILPEAK